MFFQPFALPHSFSVWSFMPLFSPQLSHPTPQGKSTETPSILLFYCQNSFCHTKLQQHFPPDLLLTKILQKEKKQSSLQSTAVLIFSSECLFSSQLHQMLEDFSVKMHLFFLEDCQILGSGYDSFSIFQASPSICLPAPQGGTIYRS